MLWRGVRGFGRVRWSLSKCERDGRVDEDRTPGVAPGRDGDRLDLVTADGEHPAGDGDHTEPSIRVALPCSCPPPSKPSPITLQFTSPKK